MKTYKLINGDQMPALGLGTWKSDTGEVYAAIRTAIKLGYRHFDCAFIYENEHEIGQALGDAIGDGEVERKELWITSKLWNTHHKKEDVMEAIKSTLSAFGLDYLDLYLMHWPVAQPKDSIFPASAQDLISLKDIPLEETWQGLEQTMAKGLARHIGVSNFSKQKIELIHQTSKMRIEVNQVELHPLLQQKELLTYCKHQNIVVTAYSPLGSRDRIPQMKAENEPDLFTFSEVTSLADKYNCSPAQLLIAWAINRGTVVIPKSTNQERLAQNLAAASIDIANEDMSIIARMDKHFRYVTGAFFAIPGTDYSVDGLWDE